MTFVKISKKSDNQYFIIPKETFITLFDDISRMMVGTDEDVTFIDTSIQKDPYIYKISVMEPLSCFSHDYETLFSENGYDLYDEIEKASKNINGNIVKYRVEIPEMFKESLQDFLDIHNGKICEC